MTTGTDDARALSVVREELAALRSDRARGADFNQQRLDQLLVWFEHVGERETTLADFMAYANAIGCTTIWRWKNDPGAPAFPLLTVEGLAEGGVAEVRARLVELVGTNTDAALAAFVNAVGQEG